MINVVKRQCISHVVSGASLGERLLSSVMEVKVEEKAAAAGPQNSLITSNNIKQKLR